MISDVQFQYEFETILRNHGMEAGGRVQKYIDSEVLRLSEPLVPKDTGMLITSGITSTQLGSGKVTYNTPYARRWYYMPANFNEAPNRGNYWFERMKAQYKQSILAGALREASK